MAYPGTIIKPSIGFQARFFLGGVGSPFVLERLRLGTGKSPKSEKTRKKVKNNFGGTPVFPPKLSA
jgi:hypothetical protein